MSHTPTPWKTAPLIKGLETLGTAFVRTDAIFNEHGQTDTQSLIDPYSNANAAFIVQAVNAHDRLVDLVKEARDYVTARSYHSREACLKDLDVREKRLMAKVAECEAALAGCGEET